ncbi:MAG TPA: hypothetical protein PK513_04920 [Alphaproteobacteria bacterium]|nr:hypothetical protein [Alphaproteobacteria bacterium]USO06032.1 MAG: hypothetical protein H6859_02165 [Rhodospirillales bacterium]HOO81822.1 hypothetical protein [Alphaproteobacteria bacterium]
MKQRTEQLTEILRAATAPGVMGLNNELANTLNALDDTNMYTEPDADDGPDSDIKLTSKDCAETIDEMRELSKQTTQQVLDMIRTCG